MHCTWHLQISAYHTLTFFFWDARDINLLRLSPHGKLVGFRLGPLTHALEKGTFHNSATVLEGMGSWTRGGWWQDPPLVGTRETPWKKAYQHREGAESYLSVRKITLVVIMAYILCRRENRAERPGGEMGQWCRQEEEGLDKQAVGLGWTWLQGEHRRGPAKAWLTLSYPSDWQKRLCHCFLCAHNSLKSVSRREQNSMEKLRTGCSSWMVVLILRSLRWNEGDSVGHGSG